MHRPLFGHKLPLSPLVLLLLLIAPLAAVKGQDESVKPGINDRFYDADVDQFINIFEGESRVIFRHRHAIVAILGLEEGMRVADVGAGTGLFTRLIAPAVGEKGRVYAVDISQKFLDHIMAGARDAGDGNVLPVLCDQDSTQLEPDSVDLVFVCDTYHHFEFPQKTLASIHQALRPEGRLIVVDFERIQGVTTPWIVGHVRCGKGTVSDEVKDAGFELVDEVPMMQEQYILRFKKRADDGDDA